MTFTANSLHTYNTLNEKVVVVVGGLGLLGRSFSRAIAACGGRVVVADLVEPAGNEFVTALNVELGADCADFAKVNLTSATELRQIIHACHAKHGRIDAVVNTAYPRGQNYGRRVDEVEYADFCATLNLHLGGYFLVAQQFALFFREQGFGQVISVASIYGVMAPRFEIYKGTSITMPVEYAAIKSALIHLNRYLAKYFRGTSLRFNCISPGGILDRQPAGFVENYNANSNSKGLLSPDDIVGTLVFLLSDASAYINGQNLIVDDGWTL
jgi:NAD(P)-dependent dehydrogenase (short-subunit alcohol dehydrogenase family)